MELRGGPKQGIMFTVCVVGEAGVGKTCLLHRFCGSNYPGDGSLKSTIGTDTFMTRVECMPAEQLKWAECMHNGAISVVLRDTAGQERFAHVPKQVLRAANVVVMVYSLDDSNSLQQLKDRWYPLIREACQQRICMLVVGNKNDLMHNTESLYQNQLLENLCQHLEEQSESFSCIETSAKTDPEARLVLEALIKRAASRVVAKKPV